MLRVTLKRSRQLAAALTAAHAGAAITLVPLDVPIWGKLALTLLITASLGYTLRRHALLRSSDALMALELREGDSAAIKTGAEDWREARILGTTYVSPSLTVVNVRVPGLWRARHIVIVSDNADAESFRRLRVRLRWSYRQSPTEQGLCAQRPPQT